MEFVFLPIKAKSGISTDFRDFATKLCGYCFGRFATCGNYRAALWNLAQKCWNIGLLNYFQMSIRGIVHQPSHRTGGIEDCNVLLGAELYDLVVAESELLPIGFYKVVLVVEEDKSHDSPHIILYVRVVEVHRPSFALGRKTAEHKNFGTTGKKWLERMLFYRDVFLFGD